MTRYYLHVCEDGMQVLDRTGKEFADFGEARSEAQHIAKNLLVQDMLGGQKVRRVIEIVDEEGRLWESLEATEVQA